MPVVIIHTVIFAIKSFVHILSRLVPGSNVYVFCIVSSALAMVQCRIFYRNPNYESEVVFYILSGILEIIANILVVAFKIWPKMSTESVWVYSFLVVITLFILADILAFAFLWVRVLRNKLRPEQTKSSPTMTQSEPGKN